MKKILIGTILSSLAIAPAYSGHTDSDLPAGMRIRENTFFEKNDKFFNFLKNDYTLRNMVQVCYGVFVGGTSCINNKGLDEKFVKSIKDHAFQNQLKTYYDEFINKQKFPYTAHIRDLYKSISARNIGISEFFNKEIGSQEAKLNKNSKNPLSLDQLVFYTVLVSCLDDSKKEEISSAEDMQKILKDMKFWGKNERYLKDPIKWSPSFREIVFRDASHEKK